MPPLVAEILDPVIEAIAGDSDVVDVAKQWINTDKTVEQFAQYVIGGLNG